MKVLRFIDICSITFVSIIGLCRAQVNFDDLNAGKSEKTTLLPPECRTTDKGPSKFARCVFPFKLRGKTYTACTNEFDPQSNFWCSTKIDSRGNHVAGGQFWGYCNENCSRLPEGSRQTDTKRTTLRPTSTARTRLRPTATARTRVRPTVRSTVTVSATTTRVVETSNISDPLEPSTSRNDDKEICGISLEFGFIVGGREAKRGSFPFLALLGFTDFNGGISYLCGGTLISRRYVITAAHCHHRSDENLQIKEVVLGEHDLSQESDCIGCPKAQKFSISPQDVTIHENYVDEDVVTTGNDIALVRLPADARTVLEDSSQLVLPICMPRASNDIFDAKEFKVAGWGRTSNEDITGSSILQEVSLPAYDGPTCIEKFPKFNFINSKKHLCAGGVKGQDTCGGDSGGPLIAVSGSSDKMYLAGIVSFGTSRCGSGFPGIYTNVLDYLPWIFKNMK